MKKYILFALLVVMCLLLTACQCEHEWQKADCVNPRLCAKCSESQGVALGHSWASATCDAAKTCTRCGQLEGSPLGHAWEAATCDAAKTCKNCGKTEGDPLGHTADPATCETAGVCKTCGKDENAGSTDKDNGSTGACDHTRLHDESFDFGKLAKALKKTGMPDEWAEIFESIDPKEFAEGFMQGFEGAFSGKSQASAEVNRGDNYYTQNAVVAYR